MSDIAEVAFRTVGRSQEVVEDLAVPFYVEARKRRISVARVGSRLYAFDDLCTCGPGRCPLSGGLLSGTTIICQCHGSEFDIVSGGVITGPAVDPLNVYAVEEVQGAVRVRV